MKTVVYFDCMPSPLGAMVLASDGDALSGAWFDGQRHQPAAGPAWQRRPDLPILCRAAAELTEYFAGERIEFDLPLAPAGTPFQREVWHAIADVRYGETIAYHELAARAGRPESIRAAGAATGRNPLSIIIPCHRIVAADGALTGYAGGLARKRALQALETAAVAAATATRAARAGGFAHVID
jgi:methylated-DNA-[protein]-cysteine S-methyltransferase